MVTLTTLINERFNELFARFDELTARINEFLNNPQRGPEVSARRGSVRNPRRDLGTIPQRNIGMIQQRGSRANERRIPRIAHLSRPEIQDFFADYTDFDDALDIVEMIEKACYDVCKEYRRSREQYRSRYWTTIPQYDKKEMINSVLEEVMNVRGDIGDLLSRCVDLWPIAYFLQIEWTATRAE